MAISPRSQQSNTSFNAKAFLGYAGLGKVLKKYTTNEVIFTQGDVAGAVIYISKRKSQSHGIIRARQGSRGRNSDARAVLWRRMS